MAESGRSAFASGTGSFGHSAIATIAGGDDDERPASPIAHLQGAPPEISTCRFRADLGTLASTEPPRGVGETGTSAIVPAIADAIFAATGKRLRKMPIDASLLKEA
jgi:hypothetical protein